MKSLTQKILNLRNLPTNGREFFYRTVDYVLDKELHPYSFGISANLTFSLFNLNFENRKKNLDILDSFDRDLFDCVMALFPDLEIEKSMMIYSCLIYRSGTGNTNIAIISIINKDETEFKTIECLHQLPSDGREDWGCNDTNKIIHNITVKNYFSSL